jgi:hypothetical protein
MKVENISGIKVILEESAKTASFCGINPRYGLNKTIFHRV